MKLVEFDKLLEKEIPILIDFYSTTCDPCKWLLPILAEVETHFQQRLKVIKINVEQSTELAHQFDIRSVPTLILIKNKQPLWRIAGFDTAPVMIKIIEELLRIKE